MVRDLAWHPKVEHLASEAPLTLHGSANCSRRCSTRLPAHVEGNRCMSGEGTTRHPCRALMRVRKTGPVPRARTSAHYASRDRSWHKGARVAKDSSACVSPSKKQQDRGFYSLAGEVQGGANVYKQLETFSSSRRVGREQYPQAPLGPCLRALRCTREKIVPCDPLPKRLPASSRLAHLSRRVLRSTRESVASPLHLFPHRGRNAARLGNLRRVRRKDLARYRRRILSAKIARIPTPESRDILARRQGRH